MQDLDDQAQKLRAIFLDSATAVPMADEAAANKALEAYQSLQHASDRLFDLLIVLKNTYQTVGTVRSLANHFFLANVLDSVSEPIAEALNNIAACLPGIAKPDGKRIPSGPVQPGASSSVASQLHAAVSHRFFRRKLRCRHEAAARLERCGCGTAGPGS